VLDEHARASGTETNPFERYEHFARRVGLRLGELHAMLAQQSDNPDFAPETIGGKTVVNWQERAARHFEKAFAVLSQQTNTNQADRRLLASLHGDREKLMASAAATLQSSQGAQQTRVHGDLHLTHVLVAADDVIFTTFGGDPLKPIEER